MVDTPESASADILIVEDDAQVRAMLRQMLEVAGFRVREAVNGKEAMKSWKADHPDLIITDVLMPEMDGFEVITTLRKLDPHSKIIAITGGGRREADQPASRRQTPGGRPHPPKTVRTRNPAKTSAGPFGPDGLVSVLSAVLTPCSPAHTLPLCARRAVCSHLLHNCWWSLFSCSSAHSARPLKRPLRPLL